MAKERIDRDAYLTPYWCIDGLMPLIRFNPGDVLSEPAKGDGRIIERFPPNHKVKWAEIAEGVDYLTTPEEMRADVIVTNPPYSHALEFISTALDRDLAQGGTLILLLRTGILGSKTRADFWRKYPPTHQLVLTPRPSFAFGGSDNSEYAWFCWDYGNRITTPHVWTLKKDEIEALAQEVACG
ncbi:class I SAM-dependent methyltransferase [Vibrio parahaemolyticus]|uniref:DNA methyltransferase n=1 Tax=Vibrio parahaemolyticus TaxID=670 RepID=UPI00226B4027|nr:DNA methyltransferase [Vibrio parahaemolyticus]MCX8816997.1 class I SAM-dependent methyltransferase [Vibrio parahaemolyticus]